jgi:excisionase family DNA binding protein
MPRAIDGLPLTATINEAAEVLGFKATQVRALISIKRIAFIRVGSRYMIPRDAIQQYLLENTVQPCHDEIPARVSAFSKSGNASISSGPMVDAAASAQRLQRIAHSLKRPSPTSSTSEPAMPARVIPLRSQ